LTVIYVDADACPVKAEIERVASRHRLEVYLVSNSGLRPGPNPLIRNILVPDGPDVADDWIAGRAQGGDIVITADIPLASRCLERGARVLSPKGRPFTAQNIGNALATRALMQHLRELEPGSQTINAGFTAKDRSAFLSALENEIRAAQRGS